MTELQLYKFITDNDIEWHRRDNDGALDVIIFPAPIQIEYFQKILSSGVYDDNGIKCIMREGYFAFWMKDICEYYGIDMDKVFIGEES